MTLTESLGKHAIDRIMEKKLKLNADERSEVPESVDMNFGDYSKTQSALMLQLRFLIQTIRTDDRIPEEILRRNLFSDEISAYLEDLFQRFENRGVDSSRCSVRKDLMSTTELLSNRYQDMITVLEKKREQEENRAKEERELAKAEVELAKAERELAKAERDRWLFVGISCFTVLAAVVIYKFI